MRRRGQSDPDDDGWYIDHFSAVFMLDGDAPEALERRRIVATRHQLTEIAIVLDTPRESGQRRLGLKADVTSGGTLLRSRGAVAEPDPLHHRAPAPAAAQPGPRVRDPHPGGPDEPMRDYYVFRPERRCDRFDLRVRFDRRRPPRWVRQEFTAQDVHVYYPYGGSRPPFERVAVDPTGEARATFPHPRQHLGYGLQLVVSPTRSASRPPTATARHSCPPESGRLTRDREGFYHGEG